MPLCLTFGSALFEPQQAAGYDLRGQAWLQRPQSVASLPGDGDQPKQDYCGADQRRGDRAYNLELQQIGLRHREPIRETAGLAVLNNAAY